MGNRCETRREETMRKGGREETILVPLGQYCCLDYSPWFDSIKDTKNLFCWI